MTVETEGFEMRTVHAALGSLLALAIMTAPAGAKNISAQPAEEKAASPATPACHTLQPGPDGIWVERPCQELGEPAAPPVKPARRAETAGH